jgi:RHS repeat-associated protein
VQDYHEGITYDENGNIQTYLRNGSSTAGGLPMDNLTYGYNLDVNGRLVNNKLRHIKDAVNAGNYPNDIDNEADDNYTYDNAGELVADQSANIQKIKWNIYGKIESITKPGINTITYGYDASGNRINKTVTDVASNTTTVTHYVRDGQGNVFGVYTYKFNGGSTQPTEGNWLEQHLYGRERIGVLSPGMKILPGANTSDSYAANSSLGPVQGLLGLRSYELVNHLHNVLAVISDKKIAIPIQGGTSIDHYEADVQTMEDYYPFGMGMPGRIYAAAGVPVYRYGFNGKENDDEVKGSGDQIDYGMRMYDPRAGRFLSVDPLQKKFADMSPYVYAMDRPVDGVDLDGLEWYYSNFFGWTKSNLVAEPPCVLTEEGMQEYYNKLGYFTLKQAQQIFQNMQDEKRREEDAIRYQAAQEALIKIQLMNNPFYLAYEFSPVSAAVNAYTAFRDGNTWEGAINVALAIGGLSELRSLGLAKFSTFSDFFNVTKLAETGVGDLWKVTNNFIRGTLIENKLAQTLYQGYEHLGTTVSKYFKAIDFYKEGLGVSLKTVNAQKNFEFKNIFKNIDDLAEAKKAGSIVSQGAERRITDVRLDIAVPEGYNQKVLDEVKKYATSKGVKINIFEAK